MPLPGEKPGAYASRAARGKAEAALALLPSIEKTGEAGAAILAGDTIVVLDGRILGKPSSPDEALEMLTALAGRAHTVITACCLLRLERQSVSRAEFAARSRVYMWKPPQALLCAYAAGVEPLDKAGAYALQGEGAFLVRRVEGSCSNVIGLPLSEVIERLLDYRVISHL